jgi:DNA-binding NarL/FixJ family response regulator
LIEDHRILREGLRAIFSAQPDLEVVGEGQDGMEGVGLARALQPDLVVLDLSMPRMNGIEALREIKRVAPGARVLILTVQHGDEYVRSALEAGADGYLLKTTSAIELLAGLRAVWAKGSKRQVPVISPGLERHVGGKGGNGQAGSRPSSADSLLSPREHAVLKLVAEGYRSREIGKLLSISEKTVEKHRTSLLRKLQVTNVSGLTAYAIEKGLVTR